MFDLYTYSEEGELIWRSEHETVEDLNKAVDLFQDNNVETFWEWVE